MRTFGYIMLCIGIAITLYGVWLLLTAGASCVHIGPLAPSLANLI